jgi:chemotaxis protein MotB
VSDGGHGGGKRRGHEEEHEEHENHERWLVSYADMMTLLMVLFIVMFAISQVDQRKFAALKTGLSAGFGAPVAILPGGDALLDPGGSVAPDSVNLSGSAGGKAPSAMIDPQAVVDPDAVARLTRATEKAQVATEVKNLKKAQAQLKKALDKAGLSHGATFRFDERGLIVSIATDKVLFGSGGADLLPAGRRILATIAPTLRRLPNRLSVDGHTNSVPISTARFPSNWELSTDRATGVLRYLVSDQGIPASRLYATGFADTRPLVEGPGRRALVANRRVEIVVLARIDNSAGRAVAELGNTATQTAATASADRAATEKSGTEAASTMQESGGPADGKGDPFSPASSAAAEGHG